MTASPAASCSGGPGRSPLPARAVHALADLVERHALGVTQAGQLRALLEHQLTDAAAPTAVRDATDAVHRHLADSLAALDLGAFPAAGRCVDIGSGAGYPGLPLAIARPGLHVTLLESVGRKCRYLEEAAQAAGASNVSVSCARAEEARALGMAGFAVATARAVAPAPVVLEYGAPLLKLGGLLVDWRGPLAARDDSGTLAAAALLGLKRTSIEHADPFPGAGQHYLYVYVKVRDTPERFPRRPGIARKRPLPG